MNERALAMRVAGEWAAKESFTIDRPDSNDADRALRKMISEMEDLLDRYRHNEGVQTKLVKEDHADRVKLTVALSEHEAVESMIRKMEALVKKLARRNKLEVDYSNQS